MQMFT